MENYAQLPRTVTTTMAIATQVLLFRSVTRACASAVKVTSCLKGSVRQVS